ncbi:MAG TPA: winged helix DNA-binding domain-containing protein [Kofleriaceae bacterium]|nr:winged helix DNA-binding domain-containing protein [Kofleriaceae bacterium]
MCAMQAQDYAGGLWAVGLRTRGETEATIEAALAAGDVLRTHPMRGTHHLVARADIRWLIALMGPLMIARNLRRNRELGLDEKQLARALSALEKALRGGHHLTRAETAAVLKRAKIAPDGQRLAHIVYRAELEGLVCSGARKGKQVTIALVDERAPKASARSREDSLADLATRYFTTRGPAKAADFAWWCQLKAEDVRAAMALARIESDGLLFWKGTPSSARGAGPRALLLPPFDEYTVAYRDRSAAGTPPAHAKSFGASTLLGPNVVLDGAVIGSWKRAISKKGVSIELDLWTRVAARDKAALAEACDRYAAFLGVPRI